MWNADFLVAFTQIIDATVLAEIENVIDDAGGRLDHRGHVVALAQLCAIDTLSSYACRDLDREVCGACGRSDRTRPRYVDFIRQFFPPDYRPHADAIYGRYRNSVVHSWHLFRGALSPGEEDPVVVGDSLQFGLLNFERALRTSVVAFLEELGNDQMLQQRVLLRYKELREQAIP